MGSNQLSRRVWKGNYDWIITLISRHNPKKAGSNAFHRFARYRSGMTANQYVLACKDAPGSEDAKMDLTWDSDHGYIEIAPVKMG